MQTSELVGALRGAGLSPYQADAYVTLLESGTVSAQELATASDVPGPRIYDVLDSLEEAGYIVTYERDQLYAEAVDPETGLHAISERIGTLQRATKEIRSRWQAPPHEAIDISVVKRFRTVIEHTRENIVRSQHQVLVALTYQQFLTLESVLRSAVQRGVSVQVSLHSLDEEERDAVGWSQFDGAVSEMRVADVPCMYEPFLAIIDGTAVSFAPFGYATRRTDADESREPTLEYGVLVDDPMHAYVFEWYFLAALWEPSASVHVVDRTALPMEFVDVREVVRTVDPLLREGATVAATVEGRRVASGRRVAVEGRIVSVESDHSQSPNGSRTESLLTRRATVVLDAEEGAVSVGGKGAYDEDVEASRIIVTEVVRGE